MIKRVRWLCAAVAAAVLVAACGGGGSSSSSSTTTTQAAKTTTSKTTTTTTAAATKTTTSTTVSISPANKAAALASCKSAAKTYTAALGPALPANFASEINAICQRVASGNITGAKAIAREVCNQLASALPSGQEKSAVQTACKSIG